MLSSKNQTFSTERDSWRCDDILAAEVRGNTWRANFEQEDLVEEAVKRNGGGGGESGRWRSWVRVRVRNFRVPGIPGKRVFGEHHLRRLWLVEFFLLVWVDMWGFVFFLCDFFVYWKSVNKTWLNDFLRY